MKRILFLLFIFFLFPKANFAQNASSYCFTTGTKSYSTLSGTTNFSGINANADDAVSDVTSLPFDFIFGGQVYSQITISSNGWLSFVLPSINTQQNYTNTSINASAIKPLLMPLWDDLKNANIPRYVVSGSAPNRIYKVEWSEQKWNYQSNNDVISFQIWLYETSNVIEYTYNRGAENVTNGSATIGLYDAADTFLTLNNSGTSPTSSATSFTTDISAKPASNQVYRFSPPVPSSSVGTYTFCVDNTQTTANVSSGRYATVNVVKGFNYTVSVGDVFASSHENLTLLDATSANVLPPITATGNTGTSITWTATSSGTMRVLLTSTCGSTGSGPMSLSVNSVGNTQDSQTTFGTDQWVGHVYNHVDGPPPGGSASPTSPSTTTSPFLSANYVGYYNIASETINEGFGGNTTCFPVLSNGVVRTSIYTELFSVRYRMKSTRAAGCYFLNVNGDDGVRVYVDGVLVFNQWKQQGNTAYCNNLIYLNGNSDIILDYYEHQGGNVVGFSLTPFDGSANIITSSLDVKVCSGVSPGLIDAASFGNCTGGTNTIYQWQISNDNINFTDISGITSEDYTPGGIANATTSNIIKYYRRVLKAFASNASGCSFNSNVVKVTTSPSLTAPAASAGTGATCSQITANWQVQTNATAYLLDVSLVSNFTSFVTGFQNLNVGNVVTYNVTGLTSNTTYYYRVRAINSCGTSLSSNVITYATIAGPTFIVSPGVSSCPNADVTYTTQSSMANYIWIIPGTLGTDYSIISGGTGANSNTVTLNWLTSGSKTVTVNYTLTCSSTTPASSTTSVIIPNNISNGFTGTTICNGSTGVLTFDADDTGFYGPYVVKYTDGTTVWSTSIAAKTLTAFNVAVNPIVTTTYSLVSITNGNGCVRTAGFGNSTAVLTVKTPPTVPVVGTITQPCVVSTGSVVLSGLPASGIVSQTGTAIESYTITGTTMTISGLATGTYQFSASNGTCSSAATGNVVINILVTNTWSGATPSWSTGSAPTSTQKIVFNANYPPIVGDPNIDIVACSCEVLTARTVTIKSDRTLKITNDVSVIGTGKLIFENNASLVQINNSAVNTGDITYRRLTKSPISNFDYVYWSSPVSPQTLYDVSPNTRSDKFYSFDAIADDWKEESSATNMVTGIGYIIRGPQTNAAPAPPNFFQASFKGVPNNGIVTIPITPSVLSNYLLGNPYPSALDADEFLSYNSSVLDGTIYFWTHNTQIALATGVSNPGSGTYAYTSDDYASYNLTGGVGTAEAITDGTPGDPNDNKPTGKIAAGQSFLATSITSGTVEFNNSMRVGVGAITGANTQFFKYKEKSKKDPLIEKTRLWLNLTNNEGAFKQTLIGYIDGATNNYESGYDGESFDGNEFIDFYSVNQNKNLVIQGRAVPFVATDEVPLGYNSTIEGSFKISIDQVDGLLEDQKVFLEDKFLGTFHDLKKAPYNFSTEKGTFNDRFVVLYKNKTLASDDPEISDNHVVVSNKNKEIKINSSVGTIDKVIVFDISGKKIYEKSDINALYFKIVDLLASQQVLLIKTVFVNGDIVTKKIIY